MRRARGGTTYHKLIRNYREKKHVNFIVSRIFRFISIFGIIMCFLPIQAERNLGFSEIGNEEQIKDFQFPKLSALGKDTNLSGVNVTFVGEDALDWSGDSVTGVGDVNNDGLDDFVIGADGDDDGGDQAGQAYLILGKPTIEWHKIDLSLADASFIGEEAGDNAGHSVSGVGDVNNDGYDDFIIGANGNNYGGADAGQVYLILGRQTTEWVMRTDLSNANASFIGEEAGDYAGWATGGAGDVNNDEFDDFIIGAMWNDEGGNNAGQTYVIFGQSTNQWTMRTDLSAVNGSFTGSVGNSGHSIAGIGDVNGDNYDDFLIDALWDDYGGSGAGQVFLILGRKTSDWMMNASLATANASFVGESANDYAGRFVAGPGDVNNDGFDDFLIGAYGNDYSAAAAGQVYLFFGSIAGWEKQTSLSTANASFLGEYAVDKLGLWQGWSKRDNCDVNGDDFDDFIFEAGGNDEGGANASQTYLIYGRPTANWTMRMNLTDADASFLGEAPEDGGGYPAVAMVGDANGDGFGDFVVGLCGNDEGGVDAGKSYLIFGEGSGIAPIQAWNRTWGGGLGEKAFGVAVDGAGNIVIVGQTSSFGGGNGDAFIAKYDTEGTRQWNQTWGGNDINGDQGWAAMVDAAGNAYIAGYTNSYGAGSGDALVVKYDTGGTMLWNKTWGGTGGEYALAGALDKDGNIFLAGYSIDAFIVKLDTSGTELWNCSWGGAGGDQGWAVEADRSGNAYLVGRTNSFGAGNDDAFIAKYNAGGTQLWNRTWGGGNEDWGVGITTDNDENVYLVGRTSSFGEGNFDAFIVKYNASGTLLWERTVGGGMNEIGWDVGVDESDNAYLVGSTSSFGAGNADAYIVKYAPDGTHLWSQTWSGIGTEEGLDIFIEGTDKVYLAGYTNTSGAGGWDALLVKFLNPSGVEHAPISINGNAALDTFCAGNGTDGLSWPTAHVLGNFSINGEGSSNCIDIRNTDRFLVIRNVSLVNGKYTVYNGGLTIINCTNILIQDVNASNNGNINIYIGNSTNITITECIANNAIAGSGIYLFYSNNITISNTSSMQNTYGIYLDHSSNNTICDTNASWNWNGDGIYLSGSGFNNVTDNYVSFNNRYGISVAGAQSNIIFNNVFVRNGLSQAYSDASSLNAWDNGTWGNLWGDYQSRYPDARTNRIIWDTPYAINCSEDYDQYPLYGSSNITGNHAPINLDGNTAMDNFPDKSGAGTLVSPYVIKDLIINAQGSGSAILLKNIDRYVTIRNCTLTGSGSYVGSFYEDAGFFADNSKNLNITNCTFFENYHGVDLMRVNNSVIENNTFRNNQRFGFRTTYSFYNKIQDNLAQSNFETGFNLLWSGCTNLTGNIARYNQFGFAITTTQPGTPPVILRSNFAVNNKDYGIYLYQGHNCSVENNTASGNDVGGILFTDTRYSNITNNEASMNGRHGIYLWKSNFTWIYNNSISGNLWSEAYSFESSPNWWDNGSQGNYWGDYSLRYPEATNDGQIWNMHYAINGSTTFDNYPVYRDPLYPILFTPPNTTPTYPADSQFVNITIRVVDFSSVSDVWIEHNQTTLFQNYTMDLFSGNNNDGVWNFTIPPASANSIIVYRIWANDTSAYVSVSGYYSYFVSEDNAPVILSTGLLNGQIFNATAPGFSLLIQDENPNATWYSLDGGLTNTTCELTDTLAAQWGAYGNGTVTVTFWANDTLGNENFISITLQKDIIAPSFMSTGLISGKAYNGTAPSFSLNIVEGNLNVTWYSLDGGLTNTTCSLTDNLATQWAGRPNGTVIVTFWANDSAGNVATISIGIYKDVLAPIISSTGLKVNQIAGIPAPTYVLTIMEDNLNATWYSLNGGLTNTTCGLTGTLAGQWGSRPNGTVTVTFWAKDIFGNTSNLELTLRKDIITPIIHVNVGESTWHADPPAFTLMINEPNLESTWYSLDGGKTNHTISSVSGGIDSTAWNAMPLGQVTIQFYARDAAGNEAYIEVKLVKILPWWAYLSIVLGIAIPVGIFLKVKLIPAGRKRLKEYKELAKIRKVEKISYLLKAEYEKGWRQSQGRGGIQALSLEHLATNTGTDLEFVSETAQELCVQGAIPAYVREESIIFDFTPGLYAFYQIAKKSSANFATFIENLQELEKSGRLLLSFYAEHHRNPKREESWKLGVPITLLDACSAFINIKVDEDRLDIFRHLTPAERRIFDNLSRELFQQKTRTGQLGQGTTLTLDALVQLPAASIVLAKLLLPFVNQVMKRELESIQLPPKKGG